MLKKSLDEFGDLSGVVFNRQTNRLIGGHQRVKVMPKDAEIVYNEKFTEPDRVGTVAHGHIVIDGVQYAYRETEWGEEKEKAANLAANQHGGEWDFPKLTEWVNELDAINLDMELLGFDHTELENMMAPLRAAVAGDKKETSAKSNSIYSIDEMVEAAFQYFRNTGFPYPLLSLHEQMQEINELASAEPESLKNSNVAYRVADTYHRHRFHASAINMCSPVDSFHDDIRLRKAIRWQFEQGQRLGSGFFGKLTLVNGTQACSNFRPGFARYLYEKYAAPGAKVFDSSTGYGGRLVGFLASHCGQYIGTDPNRETYEANMQIAEKLRRDKIILLHNEPIEDLDVSQYVEACDFAFTSPPYFVKETYSTASTQSCQRYPMYESWLSGFLKPMLQKQWLVLKPGSINIVNIEDVKISGKEFELVKPTIEIAKSVGFVFNEVQKFDLQARTFVNSEGQKEIEHGDESVIILQKPN